MGLKEKSIFELLIVLLFIGIASTLSLAQENVSQKTFQLQNKTSDINSGYPAGSVLTNSIETDLLSQSYKNFDQTLSMFNLVIAGIGVLVALITLIFILGAFFGYQSMKDIKSKMDENLEKMNAAVKKVEDESTEKLSNIEEQLNKTKEICENAEESIQKYLKNAKEICDNTEKNIQDQIDKIRNYERKETDALKEDISTESNLLSNKNPPPEIIEMFKKFEKRLEAIEALGMSLEPDDLYNRGINLYFNKNYQESIEAFNNVLEKEQNNFDANIYKGLCLQKLGKYQEALQIFNDLLKYRHNLDLTYYNLACVYSLMKNKKLAIENLKLSIDFSSFLKEVAKTDEDFVELWEDADFKKLLESNDFR